MRVGFFSDLHLEFMAALNEAGQRRAFSQQLKGLPGPGGVAPAPWCDLLIAAGDIHSGTRGLAWLRRLGVPVVYVPGNHEYYGHSLDGLDLELAAGSGNGVEVLLNRVVEYGEVRVIGGTMWTDYSLHGTAVLSAELARQGLSDFRAIFSEDEGVRKPVLPAVFADRHREFQRFLRDELARPWAGKTIVVTHHAPLEQSIGQRYLGSPLSPAFAARMQGFIGGSIDLWVHGHVHDSLDYDAGGTRVVCNPGGYPVTGYAVNPAFDPWRTIDL